jgi:hypothetical protein
MCTLTLVLFNVQVTIASIDRAVYSTILYDSRVEASIEFTQHAVQTRRKNLRRATRAGRVNKEKAKENDKDKDKDAENGEKNGKTEPEKPEEPVVVVQLTDSDRVRVCISCIVF